MWFFRIRTDTSIWAGLFGMVLLDQSLLNVRRPCPEQSVLGGVEPLEPPVQVLVVGLDCWRAGRLIGAGGDQVTTSTSTVQTVCQTVRSSFIVARPLLAIAWQFWPRWPDCIP